MRRHFLLGSITLLSIQSTSSACLNDTSIDTSEQEFRSRYNTVAPTESTPLHPPINPWAVAALALGVGAAAGSTVIFVRRNQPVPA